MNKFYLLVLLLIVSTSSMSQSKVEFKIMNKESGEILPAATVKNETTQKTYIADDLGALIINDMPDGEYQFLITSIGMEDYTLKIIVPTKGVIEVFMEEEHDDHHHEEEVVVTATRLSRTIMNLPTRVEVISGEELAEKGNMKPGDIRMLLNESTGIQTQQISATSNNAGIKIQGLGGRYTQILRDGYPLYGGFSGSLSLLQIPPLDLKQVEVIKGSSSTLYGGGAIAGLVNLVSKTPTNEKELSFLANATSAGGWDFSGFYSEKYNQKLGLTVFASRNSNRPYDPADIGFTAIPKFERWNVNPRLFVYAKDFNLDFGVQFMTEKRLGGSMNYIKNSLPEFFELNQSDRLSFQLGMTKTLKDQSILNLKNSVSNFDRSLRLNISEFHAKQLSSFSEFTWSKKVDHAEWIIGANFITEKLKDRRVNNLNPAHYQYNTAGVFIQNVWNISDQFTLESGLRGDYVNEFGFELLPRVSGMWKINPHLTTRLGGGYGYKTPTIFNEDAERVYFRNVSPIDVVNTKNERSVGMNWDINYRTNIGEIDVQVNSLFFYTKLNRPLVMEYTGWDYMFKNSSGYIDTRGMETNVRLSYDDLKLFIGYTYTDANHHTSSDKEWLPLTARHRLNNVLMYEIDEKWKFGLEAYYFSKQRLSNGEMGDSYWITGFMAEKVWERISLFINFENFTDTRQTKMGSIYTGNMQNPQFKDIFAPVDGFVINGGVKLRL